MSTADAVAREAAWLRITTDSLPSLTTTAGPWGASGPFETVQAYWPGSRFAGKRTGLYVTRRRATVPRFGGQLIMPAYVFVLKLVWPVRTAAPPVAETEQQNFDDAIDLVLKRVNDLPGDHTHPSPAGHFLSVGEAPQGQYPAVDWADPEVTIEANGWLRATVTYPADDPEQDG